MDDYLFSVIIPVYNDKLRLIRLLNTLRKQTFDRNDIQVIVVDNDSAPPLVLDSHYKDWVTLLRCLQPGSYAARNKAVSIAMGRVIVFTDADCIPSQRWLSEAEAWYRSRGFPPVILAGGVQQFVDSSPPSIYGLYDLTLGIPQERYVSRGYGVTANLFVPRIIFDSVGLFDSTRLSGGDAAFCRLAGSHGFQIEYLEKASVKHLARTDWDSLSKKVRRVKGGQVLNGPLLRRFLFIIRTLLPPVYALKYAFKASNLSFVDRLKVCLVQCRLWYTEIVEIVRLLIFRRPPLR